nr:hypothetical protein [Chromobacterium amazonense]
MPPSIRLKPREASWDILANGLVVITAIMESIATRSRTARRVHRRLTHRLLRRRLQEAWRPARRVGRETMLPPDIASIAAVVWRRRTAGNVVSA